MLRLGITIRQDGVNESGPNDAKKLRVIAALVEANDNNETISLAGLAFKAKWDKKQTTTFIHQLENQGIVCMHSAMYYMLVPGVYISASAGMP